MVGPPPDGVDVVVGNPPFLGQLGRAHRSDAGGDRGGCGRTSARRSARYTDAAALFLLVGARAVRPGGAVALILPTSVLGARDAGAGAGGRRRPWPTWSVCGPPTTTSSRPTSGCARRCCGAYVRRCGPTGAATGRSGAGTAIGFEARPAVRRLLDDRSGRVLVAARGRPPRRARRRAGRRRAPRRPRPGHRRVPEPVLRPRRPRARGARRGLERRRGSTSHGSPRSSPPA